MKNVLLMIGFILLSFSSCKKVLDLEAKEYYTIAQIVQSKNCKAKCDQTPACENSIVKVAAWIDEMNIFPKENRFFILNEEGRNGNQKMILEVKVSPSISKQVFRKIKNRPSLKVEMEGKISSFDAPMNFKCIRLFQLTIEKSNQIVFQ